MKSIAMIVVAVIISLTLTSDKIRLNLTATPHFENLVQYSNFRVQNVNGVPEIYLSSSIRGPDNYRDLIMYINSLNTPTAKLYLAGNGGSLASALQLINTIRSSKTEIEVVVYGDVYSAHAILAVTAKKMSVLNNNIIFLFHVPAIPVDGVNKTPKQYCEDMDSVTLDRGVPVKKKCFSYENATDNEFNTVIAVYIKPYLTDQQFTDMMNGDDIILSYEQMLDNTAISK